MSLIIAFMTGLTAGGLGCLAIQGGLLASCLAHQLERDLQAAGNHGETDTRKQFRPRIILPISLFLLAKLIAYTILGFLLGAFGSLFQFTPIARAVLMMVIGIFMLGNGLRMLSVHPIFRYFIIETPSFVTRFIRRTSKRSASLGAPLFLGALTVLLPCGVAQAIMAVALGTGDPLQGAALLFAFTLGTFPVFFSVAYFATRLGAALEKYFNRIVALIIIALGLVSVVYGLNLAGAPISLPHVINRLVVTPDSFSPAALPGAATTSQDTFIITVSNSNGYSPKVLHLPADRPVMLIWATHDVTSCARSVVVPGLNYQTILPSTGKVPLAIPAQKKGAVINYSCSMGRRTGQLVFDQK